MTEPIYGIDLGTTYSCVSGFDENGKNIVYASAEGDNTTPSVVLFDGQTARVGAAAKNEAVVSPDKTVMCVKRSIGTNRTFRPGTRHEFRSETISALILRKLMKDAWDEHGVNVRRAIITCPAYFGINEREATKRAGELAGLDVVAIINEPSAAAFAYGVANPSAEKYVLVYDLGGGTFDATVIRITNSEIEVKSTGGDSHLGGVDWDEKIMDSFIDSLAAQYHLDVSEIRNDAEFMADLRQKAEQNKRRLTDNERVRLSSRYKGHQHTMEMTRSEFEAKTASLLQQALTHCSLVVENAGLTPSALDDVLLVGGSSIMPQVMAAVKKWYGRDPKMFNPNEAVARGAALYAQQMAIKEVVENDTGLALFEDNNDVMTLSGVADQLSSRAQSEIFTLTGGAPLDKKRLIKITNVCSKSFGNRTLDGELLRTQNIRKLIVSNLIIRNTPLPVSVTREFFTVDEGQTGVEFITMENDAIERVADPEDAVEIGRATMDGLPPNRPAERPLKIQYSLNEQGLLEIIFTDVETGRTVRTSLQTTHVISDEEMREARRVIDSYTIE